jgi:hypothetical protein
MTEQAKGSPEKDKQHEHEQQQLHDQQKLHDQQLHEQAPKKPPHAVGEAPDVNTVIPVVAGAAVPVQYGEQGNTIKFTVDDVLANERAIETGQELPKPDLPPDAMDAARQYGIIPAGKGDVGKALRPDEAPGEIKHLGSMGTTVELTPKQAIDQYGQGEDMIFPASVGITMQDRNIIRYPPGVHEVPAKLLNHPYLKASGVHTKPVPQVRESEVIPEGKEKTFQRK